jgi:hypothetical protein
MKPVIPVVTNGAAFLAFWEKIPGIAKWPIVGGLLLVGVADAAIDLNKAINAPQLHASEAAKIANEAEILRLTAENAALKQAGEAQSAHYEGEIKKYAALVAEIRQTAEAHDAEYKAEISRQTSLVAKLRQEGEAQAAHFNAEIQKQTALNSDVMQKALAQEAIGKARIAAAEAKIKEADSTAALARANMEKIVAGFVSGQVGGGQLRSFSLDDIRRSMGAR